MEYNNKEVILNEHGNNSEIHINILPEDDMRKIGFTDHDPKYWYLIKTLAKDITFNLSVCKDNDKDWQIDILDEWFLQPYDFQYYISNCPNNAFAKKVNDECMAVMQMLIDRGIISNYELGDYI